MALITCCRNRIETANLMISVKLYNLTKLLFLLADQEGVIETEMDAVEMKGGRLTIGTEIVGETGIVIGTEIEEGIEETGREVHTDHQMMTG